MDWNYAIERNREALKRVLAALVAMAGLAATVPGLPSPQGGGKREPSDAWGHEEDGAARPTLPRHLHRAVLRLLRPAEAAARRLVIAAARGLVVPPPRPRPPKPPLERKPPAFRPGRDTGIWMPPHLRAKAARASSAGQSAQPLRIPALPLFDPLPRMPGPKRRTAKGAPRLFVPSFSGPLALHPERLSKGPPLPDDRINAARLHGRLAALASALDDLPRAAKRFARWQAARDAESARNRDDAEGAQAGRDGAGARQASRRVRRVWPLKPGRPPGLSRLLSESRRAKPEVDDILKNAHSLALQALERADTS